MPHARRIARTYYAPLHQQDLEQVAYLALVKAAERFDPGRGNRFLTFAIPTIRGELNHYLRDHSWDVHVPRLLQNRAVQARRASDELAAELGRLPTTEELAGRLDIQPDAVLEALEAAAARDARPLDAPRENTGTDRGIPSILESTGSEDERLARVLDRAALRSELAVLPELERQVIGLRFLAELTQSEIARRIGVSQMQVSRLLHRGLVRASGENGDPP